MGHPPRAVSATTPCQVATQQLTQAPPSLRTFGADMPRGSRASFCVPSARSLQTASRRRERWPTRGAASLVEMLCILAQASSPAGRCPVRASDAQPVLGIALIVTTSSLGHLATRLTIGWAGAGTVWGNSKWHSLPCTASSPIGDTVRVEDLRKPGSPAGASGEAAGSRALRLRRSPGSRLTARDAHVLLPRAGRGDGRRSRRAGGSASG